MILNLNLILFVLFHITEAFHNKLMNKTKSYYKTQFHHDKAWYFLGHDISEYPGVNINYRARNKQKWDEYYTCLNLQNENLGTHRSTTPEAVLGFEGGTIRCKLVH